ncbi:tRNA (5-methylaminomethyl-2-thiouridine)(34)-methyltransferase MnmD [Phaeobacter inhibens]|uniref:tRNA (5-methylaminomethyl-2-thiouridine)(34)-methyltransferase MnmD n=1 Tax=Phaeobacter inhibens TaxID=221822 RepID=UPI000C99CEB9|nr:tRNA (5-methylaminomethyl-2-thiouridine)(34)-methyltransferase MnmD [Phaeobacter inhibens]AUQ55474.1 tRNA 5-methylaminomethyl-2-thiouridine biosynthesis bifunctional protein MnmC-like protein [Phaeobacter inhibens]AUQ79490.1 tRNA 5-methylaminomethyl-2-thiouridine biosynthesis bifunctional protein MnmC-like protein [Phaeobacter inhibens]AUR16649.1 tRNA 5-methylaminomethyl-2-thiouridine biosynthesis bifunctional protein MnmC-like protein [Phaeobacter inhibens]
MADQQARLSWRDGSIPVSDQFDDPYFSIHDGLAETEHVFLGGNDLPGRFAAAVEAGEDFHIAELGFGTGLNLLAAWRAWEIAQAEHDTAAVLHFTSFEAFPMATDDMARALEAFPEVAPWAARFLAVWRGSGLCDLGNLRVNVITGDARVSLPDWTGAVDAWFLDGFSPAKNPELWQDDLLAAVAGHTRAGGTAATYTAAGFVRRGLEAAGFEVARTPGFGRKRHMTKARLR